MKNSEELPIRHALMACGVSERESVVLQALFSIGRQPVARIARAAGTGRVYTYKVLRRLAAKKLVRAEARNGVFLYVAEPLDRIVDLIQERQAVLARFAEIMQQRKVRLSCRQIASTDNSAEIEDSRK